MKNPYLIQRGNFDERETKKGIDSILSFDYMGSSEFERGVIPNALRRIRSDIKRYIYIHVTIKGTPISIFCKKSQKDDIKQYLTELSENKHRLKEPSYFDYYINNDGYFKDHTDFWWDIENDVMFWKKDRNFEDKFQKLIIK